MLKFLCSLCIFITMPALAQAELYKLVDTEGSITFTDKAPAYGAKQHPLGRINSVGNPEFNMSKVNMSLHYTEIDGAMIVAGSVNGIAMRFVVDTGATLVAIPPQIAEQANLLQAEPDITTVQTANGIIHVSKTTIKQLMADQVGQKNVAATVQAISSSQPDLGLLGMSFFKAYNMTIKHDTHEILLEKK